MSNKQNDLYLEELEIAEQDYKDDLEAMKNAEKDLQEAYEWHKKMIANANLSAKKLQALKNKNG